ncbi:MAG: complex I subunit 1 family protein [Verrucomicrobiota bacterium]
MGTLDVMTAGLVLAQGEWFWLSYSIESLVKTALVVGIMLGLVSYTVMAERRVSAAIQDRIGPNRTGVPLGGVRILGFTIPNFSLFGLGQPIADAVKFLFKEQFVPNHVNKPYFLLAPALAMLPAIITIAAVPYASIAPLIIPMAWAGFSDITVYHPGVIANIDTGIVFIFAITSLSVYGITLGGWASNSKYSFLGGIRSSAQMISYEVALGLSIIPAFLVFSQLNLSAVIDWQIQYGWLLFPWPWSPGFMMEDGSFDLARWSMQLLLLPFLLLSFIIFLVSAFAETNRLPFDLPESETELVGGYHTEYAGMRFALFFLGEYAAMIVTSCAMVTLFLGGWSLPIPYLNEVVANPGWWQVGTWSGLLLQVVIFLGKMALFLLFFIWVRWTLPRFRYDQLMNLGWKVFLPLSCLNILAVAAIIAVLTYWNGQPLS